MAAHAKRKRVKKEILGRTILEDIDTVLSENASPDVDKRRIRRTIYQIVRYYIDFFHRFYKVANYNQLRPLLVPMLLGTESLKDCIKRIETVRKAIHLLNTHGSFTTIRKDYLKYFENDI